MLISSAAFIDGCAASAWLDLVTLCKLNLNAEAHLYFTLSQKIKVLVRDFDTADFTVWSLPLIDA